MGYAWYNGFSPKRREASWTWMKGEIAAGRIQRSPVRCEVCGETRGLLDYHAEDYSLPFGPHIYQYQLCFRCHIILHSRFRIPDVWLRYIEQLEAGAIYPPMMGRGEITKIWGPWVAKPERFGPPRGPLPEWFRSLKTTRPGETPRLF
jgi:hypothetical protein